MIIRFLIFILFLLNWEVLSAQYRIEGEVYDQSSGTPIPGTHVILGDNIQTTVSDDNEIIFPLLVSLPTPELISEFVTDTVFGYVYPLICDSSKGLYCEAVPVEIVIVRGQALVFEVATAAVTSLQVVRTVAELKVDSVATRAGTVSDTEILSNSKPVPKNLTLLKPVSFLIFTYAYNSFVTLLATPVFGLLQ